MLTRITVQGLFFETNYDLLLKNGPLTFIHAQNGFGKSTLMRLVYNLLRGNLEEVRSVPFQRMDVFFGDGSKLIAENRNQELNVLIAKNRLEEEISQDDLSDLLDTVYIGPDRTYVDDGTGYPVPAIDVYMKELSESIGKAMADSTLVPAEDDGGQYTDTDLDQMFKNTEAKLNFIRQAGFGPTIPPGYRFPPTRYDIAENREKYKGLALSLRAYAAKYYTFAESIVVFLDIVNTLFVNKTVRINEKGFPEAKMDRSGIIVPISKFSSGEKQIMIMFYLMLFRARPGSLVIVDEPEVSLHVSWQHQFGKYAKDIARIRDLQMIVSTHSPSIIHDDWDLAVELTPSKTERGPDDREPVPHRHRQRDVHDAPGVQGHVPGRRRCERLPPIRQVHRYRQREHNRGPLQEHRHPGGEGHAYEKG